MGRIVVQRECRGLVFLQKVVQLSDKFHSYISETSANVNILSKTSTPPSSSPSIHHHSSTTSTLDISSTSLFDLFLLQLIDLTEHIRLLFIFLLTVTKRQLFIILTNRFIVECLCVPCMPILHFHFFLLFL
jgi:hypothetical protein